MRIRTIHILAAVAIASMTGCNGTYQPMKDGENYLLMTGTNNSAVTTMVADGAGATYAVSVTAAAKVASDVTVNLEISAKAIEDYNAVHGTVFVPVPDDAVELSENEVTIQQGNATSNPVNVTLKDVSKLEAGSTYAIGVSITGATGSNSHIVEASRTLVIRLTRTFDFWSIHMAPEFACGVLFDEPIKLTNYTYEIKIYPHNMDSNSGDNPATLASFKERDQANSCLFRFNEKTNVEGENNRSCHRLQVKMPVTGELISNTVFENNKWYMLTVTFDGSTARLFVNGVEDTSCSEGVKEISFSYFDIGMTWTSYTTSQRFDSRICEVRVWDRALSTTEIRSNLCAVNPSTDGLKCYWKMDEGHGHVFHNSASTGSAYDLDWSKVWRDADGDDVVEQYDKGSIAEGRWIKDANSKCSQ